MPPKMLESRSGAGRSQRLAQEYMPELEEVKTRLNLSRPFEDLPTKNHYSHAQRDASSVKVRARQLCFANLVSTTHAWSDAELHTASVWNPNIAHLVPNLDHVVQMSLSALPGVDWARYSSATPGMANGGWDLLSGNGLPYPSQQVVSISPSAPPLSLLTSNGGLSSRYLPAASAEALSRHALLPAPEQRRQPAAHQVLQLAQRPLYPNFDATPARPIDYGFTRGDAAPSVPSADQQSSDIEVTFRLHMCPACNMFSERSCKTHYRCSASSHSASRVWCQWTSLALNATQSDVCQT